MSELVRICSQSELPAAGEVREVLVAGRAFCVANIAGSIAVLDAVCPHEEGPLSEGTIEGNCVVCPWHSFSFDVKTGVSPQDAQLKATVFDCLVENGELRARI